jgi:hypothetical protein
MRETLEEAGARIEMGEAFSMISVPRVNQVHVFFRARVLDLEFRPAPKRSRPHCSKSPVPMEGHRVPHRLADARALVRRSARRNVRFPRRRDPATLSASRAGARCGILPARNKNTTNIGPGGGACR